MRAPSSPLTHRSALRFLLSPWRQQSRSSYPRPPRHHQLGVFTYHDYSVRTLTVSSSGSAAAAAAAVAAATRAAAASAAATFWRAFSSASESNRAAVVSSCCTSCSSVLGNALPSRCWRAVSAAVAAAVTTDASAAASSTCVLRALTSVACSKMSLIACESNTRGRKATAEG